MIGTAQSDGQALAIKGLSLEFPTFSGSIKALDNVSIEVGKAEIVGVVGESGCGKSVTTMAATGLLPKGRYKITGGSVSLFGRATLTMDDKELQNMRGKVVSTIFQEPMNALNPTIRIGKQLTDIIMRHEGTNLEDAKQRAHDILADMLIGEPERIMRAYPFELSGGMRQRVLTAMAFSCNPGLIIADEPTTALDVTVQAVILRLIQNRARRTGTSVIFISHNVAVVSQLCDRIYVMYAGRIVEHGLTRTVLDTPQHPYTQALLRCLPERLAPKQELEAIPGAVPNLMHPPAGCYFQPRCGEAVERCRTHSPQLSGSDVQQVACWQRGDGVRILDKGHGNA
ncbi:ABC transporter ATP-binding protein [Rhizobium lusitanum]|uniref:Peptide/nickel transport system ATP-binding protein n=1 Tax=Rhizobium lusitanum TaxID=293958 RepID=A0A7X0IS65_9HYPH|nr:ABC transporter ATP-binding protein [Rhizobium lusitanum]MBB6486191.1 peptide/nickel transport system ATP-binding protein [Rhizobium lusitanum]